ncbi:hypothetical protein EON64_08635 [archaeon]|nr:MAG: hypothetical protein EON64_08635 [archaeon]
MAMCFQCCAPIIIIIINAFSVVDSQLNAKIADLDLGDDILGPQAGGISAMLAHSSLSLSKDDAPLQKMANYTGTNMTWQAPEVLLGMGYSQRSDIYSLGLVLW